MADDRLGVRSHFAGLQALMPRVIKLCVVDTSAVSKPRTTVTATTHFAGSLDDPAFGAYGNDSSHCGCKCTHVIKA